MSEFVSNPEEAKEYLPRYRFFYFILIVSFLTFASRLWYLQIIEGTELREFSEKNRIKQNKILAPRGLMLDRNGKVLVENLPGFEVVLSPQYIDNLQQLAKNVAPILGYDAEKVVNKVQSSRIRNGPYSQIRLKDNLSREEVFRLKRIRLETPGLEIRESIVRSYPLVENGAQLFGYVGEISKLQLPKLNSAFKGKIHFEQGDIIGKSGLEETLEADIRGANGISFLQVDAHGRETATNTPNPYGEHIKDVEPIHGNNAILTIDRDLQEASYKAFIDLKRIGAVVAMKTNGEILSWLSAPSYDPNEISSVPSPQTWARLRDDPYKPFRNKVIQDHHPPGSTFKPFVALAALEEKVITPTTIINAPGVFVYARRPYHDSVKGGHGNITVYEALERSSNVFFYKMGIALGIDRMYNYISTLGLGSRTGVELQREVSGIMPSAEWKKSVYGQEWQGGENLSTAIGQAFVNVTLLQMAVAYNAIGTEGKVYKPFIIKKIVDQDGKVLREAHPQLVRDLTQKQSTGIKISPSTFKIVKEGLRRVANGDRGTGHYWKVPGVELAGKTGTAQVMGFSADQIYSSCTARPMKQRHHGWYIAYAPADNPEIVVAVLTLHSCHGNTGSAPVVQAVMQAYFDKYHPEMTAKYKSKVLTKNTTGQSPVPAAAGDGD